MSPARAQAMLQQALAHHQSGRVSAAATLYAQLRLIAPRSFEAHHLGGAAALQLGQPAEAEKLLARAVALSPRSATTHMCLGLALAALGRNSDAEKSLRLALSLDPKNHETWAHLASLLTISGRLDEAIGAYEQSLRLQPAYAQALTGLGSVLHLRARSADAIALHSRALQLEPDHAKARLARAQAYQSLHRLDEARADFEAHLARHPDDLEAHSYRLFLLNYDADLSREKLFAAHRAFGQAASLAARKSRAAAAPISAPPPPTLHASGAALAPAPKSKIELPSAATVPHQKSKISVAFLSPDLRAHSVAAFLEPLLRHFDHTRFAISLYHDHFITDAVSQQLRAHADHWRNFIGQAPDVVAAQIRVDAPDLLVDLAGHTGFNRLPLYARRLAPVQIAYLGYPATTGLAEMDYRFTDALADPPGESDACHSETLIRFAPTAWAYAPPPDAPTPAPPPSSHGAPFTFGSFNNASKLSPATLRLWADVLQAVPGSRLLLKSFGLTAELLHPRLQAAQIDPARVELLAALPTTAEHLALYARLDVALDPFPYHGTTTTCEALWMGVPVVTLAGDRHADRVGVSLLTAAGHPEWIASTPSDYVRLASRLAAEPDRLVALRAQLRTDLEKSPLLDHPAQSARFAAALLACWQDHARAQPAPTPAP